MPTTEACARCAEPNASQTKSPSQSAASCLEKPSSFFSSSPWNRTFSSTRTSPSRNALLCPSTPGPTQSAPNATGLPSSSSSFFAAGRTEYFGSGPPFGRPRCDASTSRPPFSIANFNVGSVSRMRVSSVTAPSFSGTLKSTRINTRFPSKSTSLIVSLSMLLEFACHQLDQVAATAGVTPLIVVPRQHLHALVADHLCILCVHNRRIRIALEV